MQLSDGGNSYYPIVWMDEFWLLRDKLMPLNDTIEELPLQLSIQPYNAYYWQLLTQVCGTDI